MTTTETGNARTARAWPFAEARALLARIEKLPAPPAQVIFETGYGPSGLPHIGTFGEVVRTSMVRRAFTALTGGAIPTRLICFSDDMDGLRKVPENIPNAEMMAAHLGKPLTEIPDPFGEHDSFGAHNNARLREFLDGFDKEFGFDYEFVSATECYRGGQFDDALLAVLQCHEKITDVILPTLGETRRKTYSPFLPICPETRQVLQVEIKGYDIAGGAVRYADPRDGNMISVPVTGGGCKLQWKCDWAMRWFALGVDYEMSGKDLMESVALSSAIVGILGGVPPAGISYELFLDEHGQKISKSKGNGLAVEEWLRYGTPESLALFMYNKPQTAKRLFFDSIPKSVDEYMKHFENFAIAYNQGDNAKYLENPIWHIHGDNPPQELTTIVSFSLLLNLASVCNAESPDVLWGYLDAYIEGGASPEQFPDLARLVEYAVVYYKDRVAPNKNYRKPNEEECTKLKLLKEGFLEGVNFQNQPAQNIQGLVLGAGKMAGYTESNLRDWYKLLYQTLLGQEEGPRLGSFFKLYGYEKTHDLIQKAIDGELAK